MDTQMINNNKILLIALGSLLVTASFLSSCYYDNREELYGATVCDTLTVTYATSILPMLQAECLSCHSATAADGLGGGNNLEGYDNVMNFVNAGDPNGSALYGSIAWITGYSFMPKASPQISDCNISKVAAWINAGALNN